MKRWMLAALLVLAFCSSSLAESTDSLFVPPKPAKPLRFCTSAKRWVDFAVHDSSMVEITHFRGVKMDLRYATFDNVTGHDLYCGIQRAFMHKDAIPKLKRAVSLLQKEMPGAMFVVFDASRPIYAQEALRKTVRGTPYSTFVASPGKGGMHNFGLAVDMAIADSSGVLLDMGTEFDSFERCAGEVGEADALASGRLTQKQVDNRNFFRSIMKRAGWTPLNSEWWHFNAYPSKYVREHYTKFEI